MLLALVTTLSVGASFTTKSFDVTATIQTDRSVLVKERIQVNFFEAKRGIVRNIPFRTTDGTMGRTVQIEFGKFTLNGSDIPYRTSEEGGQYVLKIGDPDRTVFGPQVYEIRYRVRRSLKDQPAAGDLPARTEWFWNVIPLGWPTTIENSSVTVSYPEPKGKKFGARMLIGPKGSMAGLEQFFGSNPRGRTDLLTVQFPNSRTIEFKAKNKLPHGHGMTIVLFVPKGTLVGEDDADIIPMNNDSNETQQDSTGQWRPSVANMLSDAQAPGSPWGMALPAFPAIFAAWWASKRRPAKQGPLVTRFDPPENIGPSETGVLMDGMFNPRDFVAGLISLAQKGAAVVHRDESGLTFELLVGKFDMPSHLKQPLTDFELKLWEALVPWGPSISPANLRYSFGPQYDALGRGAEAHLKSAGLYDRSRTSMGCLGGLTVVAIFALAFALVPLVGFWSCIGVPLGLILFLSAKSFASPLTDQGAKTKHHLRGLKEFINRANKDELRYMANREPDLALFETLLPYAIAFGLVKNWVGAFEGVQFGQPDWYVSDMGHDVFMYTIFAHDISEMSRDWGSAAAAPDPSTFTSDSGSGFSSGSSGFGDSGSGGWDSGGGHDGGGGFDSGGSSGDGGGGGGGGDW